MNAPLTRTLVLVSACAWPLTVVVGVALQAPDVLVLGLAFGLLVLLLPTVVAPFRHYVLALFLASFSLFLLSRHLLDAVWPGTGALDSGLVRWTPALETHVLLALNLALLGLGVGAVVAGHLLRRWTDRAPRTPPPTTGADADGPGRTAYPRGAPLVAAVRQVGLLLLAVTVPARFVHLVETSLFVRQVGFYELYVEETGSRFSGVSTVGDMYDVAVMAVLATRPGPRLTWFVLGLYLVDGVVSLATLQRANFFLNVLLVVVYLVYRQSTRTADEPPWLRPWATLAVVATMPVLATLSQTLVEQRGRAGGLIVDDPVRGFLFSQGVSVNVVAFTEQHAAEIPDGRFYSLGPVVEFVRYRVLGLVTGETQLVGNTAERALEGHLFSHTVSYLAIPDVYVRGSGYGSSFVAELYVDGGYPGVLLGSMVIGAVTVALTAMLGQGTVLRLLALLMVRQLFFIPRGSFTGFLVNAFDLRNLIALSALALGVWVLVSHRARDGGAGDFGTADTPGAGRGTRGRSARRPRELVRFGP